MVDEFEVHVGGEPGWGPGEETVGEGRDVVGSERGGEGRG